MQNIELAPTKNEERRQQLAALMQERQDQRQSKLRKDGDEGPSLSPADAFLAQFNRTKDEIEQDCEKVGPDAPNSLALLDKIADALLELKASLATASTYLTTYDIHSCQQKVDQLDLRLEKAKAASGTKKKFSFATKKKTNTEPTKPPSTSTPQVQTSATPATSAQIHAAAGRSLQNQTDQTVKLKVDGLTDFTLENLTNCTVSSDQTTTALHGHNIKNCTILLAPVRGSVFLENCNDCTFQIAARQIRMVDCHRCKFFLFALSRPSIEACTQLSAAPYSLSYPLVTQHLDESGFGKAEENQWEQVQDFDWPRPNSPNWALLSTNERTPFVL